MKPLFISDLDGTLLNERGELDEETVRILRAMIRQGHLFTVATARSVVSAGDILKQLNLQIPAVLMNGVMLYDTAREHCIHYEVIDPPLVWRALEIFERGGRLPYRYTFDGKEFSVEYHRLYHEADREYALERQDKYPRFERVDAYCPQGDTVYLTALDRHEVLAPIVAGLRALGRVSVTFYQDAYNEEMWFCECFSAHANKAAGARRVQQLVGADRLVAFGDNTNDIPLFEAADEGYAVANGVAELRALADGVIGSNREQGVARYLAGRLASSQ